MLIAAKLAWPDRWSVLVLALSTLANHHLFKIVKLFKKEQLAHILIDLKAYLLLEKNNIDAVGSQFDLASNVLKTIRVRRAKPFIDTCKAQV